MIHKAVIIQSVSKTSGVSARTATKCVESILAIISEGLARRERIELRGFGTFEVKEVAAKTYPSAFAARLTVPAHGKIVFRPGQRLKDSVK